ncbi:stage V sporulation protein AA [Bacillus methanolicus PB1]|uniref:Stage V sporulation protein AA n=1 Tax=Bacillus methanolicus PB1 TaxID=997296 RepID=I3DWX2_BACMT|nr:stage V sporulation protein AA [Bacillus methanolicus]EIJ78743.1 stage V sporulation protein AA [Bacillus methanolicus PB1]
MENTIYIRMRSRIQANPEQSVFLKDIAQIIADETLIGRLEQIQIYQITKEDRNMIVIDVMKVISYIKEECGNLEVQTIGPTQTIIEVIYKKSGVSVPLFALIWFLLFFGSALAIMNFHEDVSMQSVHQKIFSIITGKEVKKPLLFQIPYSIGLGLGMILFFNHIFKKRINEEPSPLEVEMFNYQQNLDQYVIMYENKENQKKLNDY